MHVAGARARYEPHGTTLDSQGRVWRDNVEPVALDLVAINGLGDGYRRSPLKDFTYPTRMCRIEMDNENKRHTWVRRQTPEELRYCLETTGRRADTYDEEFIAGRRRLRGGIASRDTRDRTTRELFLQRNPTPRDPPSIGLAAGNTTASS